MVIDKHGLRTEILIDDKQAVLPVGVKDQLVNWNGEAFCSAFQRHHDPRVAYAVVDPKHMEQRKSLGLSSVCSSPSTNLIFLMLLFNKNIQEHSRKMT